jgi:hypothetical protein
VVMIMLNGRTKKLYDLLERQNRAVWLSQEDISKIIPEYHFYPLTVGGTNKCAAIGNDVQQINNDPDIDEVIITRVYHYKIATLDEARAYLIRLNQIIKKRAHRANCIELKIKRKEELNEVKNIR